MTHLSDAEATIIGSLITALIGALVALFVWWRQTRVKPPKEKRIKDAWQTQAHELDERYNRLWQERCAQYEKTIAYLEATIEKRDRERPRGVPDDR